MSPIRDDDRPAKRSGCLNPWVLGCIGVPLLLVVGCFALAGGGFLWMRSSLPKEPALERARANPAVVAALGTPLESKLFGDTNVMVYDSKTSNERRSTRASYSIPVSGPKGKGTILIEGEKRQGAWLYRRMELKIAETGAIFDLRTAEERAKFPASSEVKDSFVVPEVPEPPAPPEPPSSSESGSEDR
jgi:hypothetical protein